MAALVKEHLVENEHGQVVAVLRQLEGFTRRLPPVLRKPLARREPQPDWSAVTVAQFFSRCQWE